MFILFFFLGAVIVPQNRFKTSSLGSFVVDDMNSTACGCHDSGSLQAPSYCGPTIDRAIDGCSIANTQTGVIMNTTNQYGVDMELSAYVPSYVAEDAFKFVVNPLSPASYSFSVSANAMLPPHLQTLIQYDANDNSPCLTRGLGGVDLAQTNTQNAIALKISTEEPIEIVVAVYDQAGNVERRSFVKPPTFAGLGFQETSDYIFVSFANSTIFSDVDALEIFINDVDSMSVTDPYDYAIREFIFTGQVDGCAFKCDFKAPEFVYFWGPSFGFCPFANPAPQFHDEYRLCFGSDTVAPARHVLAPDTFLSLNDGPHVFNQYFWNVLPYENTFEIQDQSNYTQLAIDAPGRRYRAWNIRSLLFSTPTGGLMSPISPLQFINVNEQPFDHSGGWLHQFDFATKTVDHLFKKATMTFEMREPDDFGSPFVCSPVAMTGPTVQALDVNLDPIGTPVVTTLAYSFVIFDAHKWTGSAMIDLGSDLVRGVKVDWSSLNCTAPTLPIVFALADFEILSFELESDDTCHFKKEEPCRIVTGRSFIDADGDGLYNSSVDAYRTDEPLVTIIPSTNGRPDYSVTSRYQGEYVTECYPIGTTLNVTVTPLPGSFSANNPQLYTVTDDCVNEVPPVSFEFRLGVFFKIYNDVNNNGVLDMGEPGIPGVVFKLTNQDDGEMRLGTSDAFGNVDIMNISSGDHILDILDTYILFGFTQTQGMDMTGVMLTALMSNTTVILDNMGFYKKPLFCQSFVAPLYVDEFSNVTALKTNETSPVLKATDDVSVGGYGMERNTTLSALNEMWMSMFASDGSWMVYTNVSSTLVFEWCDETIPTDLTDGGNLTAIVLTLDMSLTAPITGLLTVEGPSGSVSQERSTQDSSLVFYFFNSSVFEAATKIRLELSTVGENLVKIVDVAARCELCQQSVTFSESEFTLGQPLSSPFSFSSLDDGLKVMPFRTTVTITQSNGGIFLESGSPALVHNDLSNPVVLDFGAILVRRVVLFLEVNDDESASGCTGPSVVIYGENDQVLLESSDTLYEYDAGANLIQRVLLNYSAATCDVGFVQSIALDGFRIQLDGPCGTSLLTDRLLEMPATDDFPVAAVVIGSVVLALFLASLFWCLRPRPCFDPSARSFSYSTLEGNGRYVRVNRFEYGTMVITGMPVEIVIRADGSVRAPAQFPTMNGMIVACVKNYAGPRNYVQFRSRDGSLQSARFTGGLVLVPVSGPLFLMTNNNRVISTVNGSRSLLPAKKGPFPIYVMPARSSLNTKLK